MKKMFVAAIIASMALAACGKKKAPEAAKGSDMGSAMAPGSGAAPAGSDAPAGGSGEPAGSGSAM